MLLPPQEPCKHGHGRSETPRGQPSSRLLTRQDSRPSQGEEEEELGERTESQQRNLSQRPRRRPRAQNPGDEYRRFCRHRRCEQGSRHAGRLPAIAGRGQG